VELVDPFQTELGAGIDLGGAVYLRPLLPQDIDERYVAWFRDERVTHYLEAKNISIRDALKHLVDGFVNDSWYMYAIVERVGNAHIGNIKIGPINRSHEYADIAIFIGDVHCWGKGYASLAVSLATTLAFDHFKLRKLRAGVIGGNDGSVRAFEKAGWKVEAELPNELRHDGALKSRVLLGVLNPKLS
jgi:[ribosomal protein S5]-alanine N-acetyltransferase